MRLTFKEKAAYGLGAVGKDMVYMLSASYVLYYFQDVLGVSAIAMGIILLAARVFDAFNDPIMGVIVAKTQTRWGKFRPWLFIGTITNAIVLFIMFAAPPTLDGKGLVAYAAITYIMWGVTYTMMDIPYWSMIPAFTEGGKEREGLSALARSCAGVGSAIVTIITVLAVSALGNMAASKSADNKTIDFTTSSGNLTVYVIEKDEAGSTTGFVLPLEGGESVLSITADSSEFAKSSFYSEENTNATITISGTSEYNLDDNAIYIAVDGESEASIAVYVDEDTFESFMLDSGVLTLNAEVTSSKTVERYGFKYFSLIVAVIFVVFILITCIGIKEKSTVDMQTAGVGEMFKALLSNDQAMTVVITIVLVNIATYITSNLLIYFFKYDLAGSNWQGNYTLFNTFAGGVQILAMMIMFPLLRKFFSTIKTFEICVVASVAGYIILLAMALAGVSSVYPFLIPGFFIMAAVGVMNVLVTIFLANTVDYGELKNNRRDESIIFSMQTFVVKLASGVAALVASIALSIFKIGSSSDELELVGGSAVAGLESMIDTIKQAGAAVVTGSSVVGLRLTMTLVPIFGLIVAIILFKKKYILTDEKVTEIAAEVKSRR